MFRQRNSDILLSKLLIIVVTCNKRKIIIHQIVAVSFDTLASCQGPRLADAFASNSSFARSHTLNLVQIYPVTDKDAEFRRQQRPIVHVMEFSRVQKKRS